jgi:hypothetical protein
MELVKFKDGTYGARSGNWFSGYYFYDMKCGRWIMKQYIYEYCHLTLEEARKIVACANDNGRVVNDS